MNKNKKKSNCSKSYSDDFLLKYLNDELSDADSAALEKHLLECDVCSDHLDGLLMMDNPSDIAFVAADLNSIIDKKTKTKRRLLGMEPSTFRAIAAIFLLLTISGAYILIDNLINNNKITELEGISNVEEESTQQKTLRNLEQNKSKDLDAEHMIADVPELDQEQLSILDSKSMEQYFPDEIIDFDKEIIVEEEIIEKQDVEELDEVANIEKSTSASGSFETETITSKDQLYEGFIVDENQQNRTVGGISVNEIAGDDITTVSTSTEKESKRSFWRFNRNNNRRESSVAMETGEKQEYNDNSGNTVATSSANINKESETHTNINNAPVVISDMTVEDLENESAELELVAENDIVIIEDSQDKIIDVDYAIIDFAETEEESIEPIAFALIEEKPQYPGGDTAMFKFITDNFQVSEVQESQIGGKIFVQFVIESTGKVSNVKIARGIDPYLDQEALRVVKSMPNWIPGKQRGKTVPVSFILPINIELE